MSITLEFGGATRLKMLIQTVAFVEQYNPPKQRRRQTLVAKPMVRA
ncbi:hypothetical protein E1H18_526 [Caulobacter sp. RHG1]|nr:hypothetical protein [Caulobacter sp. RHG1]